MRLKINCLHSFSVPKGTGLVLFIANQVVAQHSSLVEVTTNHLEGTSIKIIIPIERSNA